MDRQEYLLSLEELCSMLQVRKSYIYRLTSQNMIPYYKIGGLKFRRNEIEKWLQKNKIKAGPARSLAELLK